MPINDIYLDGSGKFQQNTENAGTIKYGEFSQVSINTGTVAVSAIFTGSAVNSGTIGNFLPYTTAVLVQSNSARWDAAFDAMGDFIQVNDARLVDAREPLAHTQAISTIDGLQDELSVLEQLISGAQGGAQELYHTDIIDFDQAVVDVASVLVTAAVSGIDVSASINDAITAATGVTIASLVGGLIPSAQLPSYVDDVLEYSALASFPVTGETGKIYVDTTAKKIYRWSGSTYIEISPSPGSTDSVTEGVTNLYYTNTRASAAAPVQSVAGKTGVVTLSTSDVQGFSDAVVAYAPAQLVSSVAGKTGAVALSSSDIAGFSAAVVAYAPAQLVSSVAGRTGAVVLSASDVVGLAAQISSGSAVTSVAGKTGAVALSSSDIAGLSAAVVAYAPTAPAQLVQSVAGKTGVVTLSTSDVQGLSAAVVAYAPAQLVSSVAGRTGAVALSASDVAGFNAAADARITAAAGSSVASLVNGTVPATQLPSYVDDVLEFSTLASFPVTGETGKIYVDTTSKKIYRWSGSAYVEIAASPGSTDSVTEGTTNLYFTNARASTAAPVQSVAGKTGAVTLTVLDVASAAPLSALPSTTSTASWNTTYTTVATNSATWTTNVSVASASWQQAYTNVSTNSAAWASTNFGSVSATAVSLSNATLSTYSTPVTASGDFVVITVDNKQRLIRLWDFK